MARANASQDKSVMPSEWYLSIAASVWYFIIVVSAMFLIVTWMGIVETLKWAKWRTEQTKQHLMPPSRIANLLDISSRHSKPALIERDRFASEIARQESQEKAA